MSMPSTVIHPSPGRCDRYRRLNAVDLPAPVGPTSATVAPAGARKLNSCNAGCASPYAKDTFSNTTSPLTRGMAGVLGDSVGEGGVSITAKNYLSAGVWKNNAE